MMVGLMEVVGGIWFIGFICLFFFTWCTVPSFFIGAWLKHIRLIQRGTDLVMVRSCSMLESWIFLQAKSAEYIIVEPHTIN